MTRPDRGVQVIETGDVVFSVSATGPGRLPRPYAYAARCGWLVEAPAPQILLLGLGLGGIAAELVRLSPQCEVVGVELAASSVDYVRRNPIARVEVVHSDALEYLRRTRRRFDVVLDDCFCLVGEDAVRPRALAPLAGMARSRLVAGGVYVQNTIRDECGVAAPEIDEHFGHRSERAFREWENILVVGSVSPLDTACWRRFRR